MQGRDVATPLDALGGCSTGVDRFHAVGARWKLLGSCAAVPMVGSGCTCGGGPLLVGAAASGAGGRPTGLMPGMPDGGRFLLPGSWRLACSGAASMHKRPVTCNLSASIAI